MNNMVWGVDHRGSGGAEQDGVWAYASIAGKRYAIWPFDGEKDTTRGCVLSLVVEGDEEDEVRVLGRYNDVLEARIEAELHNMEHHSQADGADTGETP